MFRTNSEIQAALARPDVKQRMLSAGMEPPPPADPVQAGAFIKGDLDR
jgi:hypothetical protein